MFFGSDASFAFSRNFRTDQFLLNLFQDVILNVMCVLVGERRALASRKTPTPVGELPPQLKSCAASAYLMQEIAHVSSSEQKHNIPLVGRVRENQGNVNN